jgi:hypothetical protein
VHPSKARRAKTEIIWHGTQGGRVYLKERPLRVNKPCLRKKGRGANQEVAVPAYEAIQRDTVTGERMLEIPLHGVSARRYPGKASKLPKPRSSSCWNGASTMSSC